MWILNWRILETRLVEMTSNSLGGTKHGRNQHLALNQTALTSGKKKKKTALTHAQCRASHFYADSPSSSEYSTGSTLLTHLTVDKPDCIAADAYHNSAHPQSNQTGQSIVDSVVEKHTVSCTTNQNKEILPICKKKAACIHILVYILKI